MCQDLVLSVLIYAAETRTPLAVMKALEVRVLTGTRKYHRELIDTTNFISAACHSESSSDYSLHDGLPNWILRDFCSQLSGPVCAIFNASIREGTVPALWKEATVIPVPKSHPSQLIETDMRPISLTPTLSRLVGVAQWENVGL